MNYNIKFNSVPNASLYILTEPKDDVIKGMAEELAPLNELYGYVDTEDHRAEIQVYFSKHFPMIILSNDVKENVNLSIFKSIVVGYEGALLYGDVIIDKSLFTIDKIWYCKEPGTDKAFINLYGHINNIKLNSGAKAVVTVSSLDDEEYIEERTSYSYKTLENGYFYYKLSGIEPRPLRDITVACEGSYNVTRTFKDIELGTVLTGGRIGNTDDMREFIGDDVSKYPTFPSYVDTSKPLKFIKRFSD